MKTVFGKILFVIGLIIIFLLLAFAVIKFVPAAFSSLANVGSSFSDGVKSKTGNAITVTSNDTSLSNGESFIVSWTNTLKAEGSYTLSYDCIDDFILTIENGDGQNQLICNNPYTVDEGVDAVQLTANLDKENAFADVPVKISFTEEGEQIPTASGNVTVTVKNSDGTASDGVLTNATISTEVTDDSDDSDTTDDSNDSNTTTNTTSNTNTNTSVNTVSTTYTGNADLAISNVVSLPNQSAVQFTVRNIGGQNTGIWYFNYTTPTSPAETFTSPAQITLGPGQGLRLTLQFNEQNNFSSNVTITVDPFNQVFEKNEFNNSTTVTVTTNNPFNYNDFDDYYYNDDYRRRGNDDADLVIRGLQVGEIVNGRFEEDDTLEEGDDVAIRFTIRNDGDEDTGSWYYEIDGLPFDRDDDFRSNRQRSLYPGETQTIIHEFDNIDEGSYNIRVDLDSDDDVDEEDERNNDDSVRLRVRD